MTATMNLEDLRILRSMIERMQKRWAEQDQRRAQEALQQEELASKVVMQEENPKMQIAIPFSSKLPTDLSIGEEKEKSYSEEFGFNNEERKERPKSEREKETEVEIEKNAHQVLDKMILGGKREVKKRKKRKFLKSKGEKKKKRTRLKKHEQKNRNQSRLGTHSGNVRETKLKNERNTNKDNGYIHQWGIVKLLNNKAVMKKLGTWKKRKQKRHKHTKNKIKKTFNHITYCGNRKLLVYNSRERSSRVNKENFSCGWGNEADGCVKKQIVQERELLELPLRHQQLIKTRGVMVLLLSNCVLKKKKKSKVKRITEMVLLWEDGNRLHNTDIERLITESKITKKKERLRHKYRKKRIRKWKRGNDIDVDALMDSMDLLFTKGDPTIKDDTVSNKWLHFAWNLVSDSFSNSIMWEKAWRLWIAGCLQRMCGIIPKSNWRGRQKKKRLLASNILKRGNEGKENYSCVSKTVMMVMMNLAAKNLKNYKERKIYICRVSLTRDMLSEETMIKLLISAHKKIQVDVFVLKGHGGIYGHGKAIGHSGVVSHGGIVRHGNVFGHGHGGADTVLHSVTRRKVCDFVSNCEDVGYLICGGSTKCQIQIWDPGLCGSRTGDQNWQVSGSKDVVLQRINDGLHRKEMLIRTRNSTLRVEGTLLGPKKNLDFVVVGSSTTDLVHWLGQIFSQNKGKLQWKRTVQNSFEKLRTIIKEIFRDKVEKGVVSGRIVVISGRIAVVSDSTVGSPFCLVTKKEGGSASMESIMKAQAWGDSNMSGYMSSKETRETNSDNGNLEELKRREHTPKQWPTNLSSEWNTRWSSKAHQRKLPLSLSLRTSLSKWAGY